MTVLIAGTWPRLAVAGIGCSRRTDDSRLAAEMASLYAVNVGAEDHSAGETPSDIEGGVEPRGRSPLEPVRTCPNCGAALADRSCKLLCPTPGCGYYLSCSDFY
jgi:hypothetical protein